MRRPYVSNRAWQATGLGLALAVIIVAAATTGCRRGAPRATQMKTIDDFETEPQGWAFTPGPGAKGSLTRDTATAAHGGQGSYKLEADFSGKDQYVGILKNFNNLGVGQTAEFSFWVKAVNLKSIGVRLIDSAGQTFGQPIPLTSADGWQHIVLPVKRFGGSIDNNLNWHDGPAKTFEIRIGFLTLADTNSHQATLWIDDLAAAVQ